MITAAEYAEPGADSGTLLERVPFAAKVAAIMLTALVLAMSFIDVHKPNDHQPCDDPGAVQMLSQTVSPGNLSICVPSSIIEQEFVAPAIPNAGQSVTPKQN